MLVSFLFVVLTFPLAAIVAFKMTKNLHDINPDTFFNLAMFFSALPLWVLLSSIGSLLPAAASGLPFSLRRAWGAGRKTGLAVAGQLLLFPGLGFVAIFALAVALVLMVGPSLDSALIAPIANTIFGALFMLPSVMTVVILVRAFKRAYLPV